MVYIGGLKTENWDFIGAKNKMRAVLVVHIIHTKIVCEMRKLLANPMVLYRFLKTDKLVHIIYYFRALNVHSNTIISRVT